MLYLCDVEILKIEIMEKTIFNVYVVMDSQETCDRMKQLCLDNELPIWDDSCAFIFYSSVNVFGFDGNSEDVKLQSFFVMTSSSDCQNHTQVTEAEFINLLKEYKNE